MDDKKYYMTVNGFADKYKFARGTVRNWCRAGRVKTITLAGEYRIVMPDALAQLQQAKMRDKKPKPKKTRMELDHGE